MGTIEAQELCGAHIDRVVKFDWEFESGVEAAIRGELRQIYHAAGHVVINLCAPTVSNGSLSEFQLDEYDDVEVE